MSFQIDFSICQQDNCNDVVVTDKSTTWGTDLLFADVSTGTISITSNDETDSYDVSSIITGATTIDDLVFDLSLLAGYSVYVDGEYEITYTILTTLGVTYTKTTTVLFVCNVECCIHKKVADIYKYYNCNKCNDKYITNALTAFALLQSLRYAIGCGNFGIASNILATLLKICNYQNCNCV